MLAVKIFVREPLGVIGTVGIPVALFVVLGRVVGPAVRSASPDIPRFVSVDLPTFASLLIAASAILSLVAIIAIYREGGILKRLRATPLRPHTILTAHVMVKLLFTAITLAAMILAGRRYEGRALFERRLDMPAVMRPRETYEKAIGLAHDGKYQQARRSLFAWEDEIVTAGWPTHAAIKRLEELVDAHDEFIKKTFKQTIKKRVFRVVEFAAEAVVGLSIENAALGVAAAGALKLVGARLPTIAPEPDNPLAQPGAALHKAISVMFHDV